MTSEFLSIPSLIGVCRLDFPGFEADFKALLKYTRAITTHQPYDGFIYKLDGNDGRKHEVKIGGTPQFDADGEFVGYGGWGEYLRPVRNIEPLRKTHT